MNIVPGIMQDISCIDFKGKALQKANALLSVKHCNELLGNTLARL